MAKDIDYTTKLQELEAILFEPVEEGYDSPTSFAPPPKFVVGQTVGVRRTMHDGHQTEQLAVIVSVSDECPRYTANGCDGQGLFTFEEEEVTREVKANLSDHADRYTGSGLRQKRWLLG